MPGNPLKPWQANRPIDHRRLNLSEERNITDLTVQPGSGLTMWRQGNSVALGFSGFIPTSSRRFTSLIQSASRDGSNWRWIYTYAEAEKTSPGYGGWTVLAGGRTGTAYNRTEEINGASGAMGNGVNVDNLADTGLELQPCPVGLPVEIELRTVPGAEDDPAVSEGWFSYENGVDGTCAPP
jgi:hypothetical protein